MTPDQYTIKETFLDVGDGHELYVHEWGNPKSKIPILFLHGGPGGACNDKHKGTFDPEIQRIIFYDQRGCGKSLPQGSLKHNTTPDLIEDIEKIARHLKFERCIINGGSWGSTLALAYAIQYPKRVKALVLNGILTCSQTEIDWLDKGRFRDFYPDVWATYLSKTPKSHQADPSTYHFARILGNDEVAAKASAYVYQNVESALLQLDDRYMPEDFNTYDPTNTIIEIHYLNNRCFLSDCYIMNNAHTLIMPIRLVQGRYDMVCPPITAYELHQKLPHSRLTWTTSGHKAEHEAWNIMRTQLIQMAQE